MNAALLYIIARTTFLVTIIGGLIFYAIYRLIASIWAHTSAAARNTKGYLRSRKGFDLYKQNVARWDEYQRQCIEKCSRREHLWKSVVRGNHDK